MTDRTCNICGGTTLVPRGNRGNMICADCRSDGRTRLTWLILQSGELLRPGLRCLHFAPEIALAPRLREMLGAGYEPVDIAPDLFPHAPGTRHFDLVRDAASLPGGAYDLILHSHVMEHVRGNVTAILYHLHRALAPDGKQVCCIPFMRDRNYAEDLGSLSGEEATARFGQDDHVRVFGARDVAVTIGMIFKLPERYDLIEAHGVELLARHAIPEPAWSGWSANSVLVLGKDDLLLKGA